MLNQPKNNKVIPESEEDRRDFVMSQKDARAGCPEDVAACGEEDNGAGLESLVTREYQAHNFY